MTDGDQVTVSVLRVFLSPTGEAQKRALFEIITPVGLGQPFPLCPPCVAMIGQTFFVCNQPSLHCSHRSILWASRWRQYVPPKHKNKQTKGLKND